ncbi:protein-tyrosine phosphatase-like protein [Chiua virens]|nr:protein-tyrosine phosphatase-like protein [Chiua virens]
MAGVAIHEALIQEPAQGRIYPLMNRVFSSSIPVPCSPSQQATGSPPSFRRRRVAVPKTVQGDAYGRVVSTITPRLYLSDLYSAQVAGTLERFGITHIVSAIEPDLREDFGDNVIVMHVPIRDDANANIAQWFDSVVNFIQQALDMDERHKVLVHCLQGISRSATLVCAYLVATTPMRSVEAIAHVRAKRGIVSPNIGFRSQLATWELQFEDAKVRAAEDQRRKAGSLSVFGDVLSMCIGKRRSRRLAERLQI